jgi:UTP:GlnB (protein PII) uridylyltransferase
MLRAGGLSDDRIPTQIFNPITYYRHLSKKSYAPAMHVEDLEIVLGSHVTDQKKFTKVPFPQRWRKREQNEKVTFGNNAFCVANTNAFNCLPSSPLTPPSPPSWGRGEG